MIYNLNFKSKIEIEALNCFIILYTIYTPVILLSVFKYTSKFEGFVIKVSEGWITYS